MKTVHIEVERGVSQERFERIQDKLDAEGLANPDFNGYELKALRGDFTCAELQDVSEHASGALLRLMAVVQDIAAGTEV
jgi:hypothetical protein